MNDLVRVRENGWEHNTGRARAEAQGLEVLDEPTRDLGGALRPRTRPNGRPVKEKTTVDAEARKKRERTPAAIEAADKEAAAAEAPADDSTNPPSTEENQS